MLTGSSLIFLTYRMNLPPYISSNSSFSFRLSNPSFSRRTPSDLRSLAFSTRSQSTENLCLACAMTAYPPTTMRSMPDFETMLSSLRISFSLATRSISSLGFSVFDPHVQVVHFIQHFQSRFVCVCLILAEPYSLVQRVYTEPIYLNFRQLSHGLQVVEDTIQRFFRRFSLDNPLLLF